MTTTTSDKTLKDILDQAHPDKLADALRQIALGSLLDPIVEEVDVSSSPKDNIVLSEDSSAGKAALLVQAVEVTGAPAMEASTGVRSLLPSGGTATTGAAVISDDGDTITFEGNVNTVKIKYLPVPETALDTDFPTTGLG